MRDITQMIPKMRWVHEYYEARAVDVREYRDRQGGTMAQAKAAMCPTLEPRLQYLDEDTQDWIDVPTTHVSLGKIYE